MFNTFKTKYPSITLYFTLIACILLIVIVTANFYLNFFYTNTLNDFQNNYIYYSNFILKIGFVLMVYSKIKTYFS